MLKTKHEIKAWLDQMEVKKYTINDDLTVDVDTSVNLSQNELTEIPVQFGTIYGCFSIWDNNLTSLKGCPIKVTESFNCSENKLTSLEYCPKEVGHVFSFSKNQISSLEYAPISVGTLRFDDADLKNLDIYHLNFMSYFRHDCEPENFIPQFEYLYQFTPKFHRKHCLDLTAQQFHAILLENNLQLEMPQNNIKQKKIKV